MVIDVKSLNEEQILVLAKSEANRNGYEIIEMEKLPYKDNYYLRYVLAYNEKKEEYVTWLFNVQFKSMNHGNYFNHWYGKLKEEAFEKAKTDLIKRLEKEK